MDAKEVAKRIVDDSIRDSKEIGFKLRGIYLFGVDPDEARELTEFARERLQEMEMVEVEVTNDERDGFYRVDVGYVLRAYELTECQRELSKR